MQTEKETATIGLILHQKLENPPERIFTTMEDIIIEEINYKAFVLVLANLFLMIASLAITVYGFRHSKVSYWLPGLLIDAILLVGFVISLIKAASIKRLLTIMMDGIVDNSSIGGVGYIPFDDIKEFLVINVYNKKAIAVIPKNIDSFLSKFSSAKRRQMKRNLNSNLPPVTIMIEMAKDMEPEDILSLLQKRLLDYSSLYE